MQGAACWFWGETTLKNKSVRCDWPTSIMGLWGSKGSNDPFPVCRLLPAGSTLVVVPPCRRKVVCVKVKEPDSLGDTFERY